MCWREKKRTEFRGIAVIMCMKHLKCICITWECVNGEFPSM
nr:MAG TPA: hypothetical protein [Caudoviricetes sp.]